ncbi:MAG: sigma-70 family RNA polymerase sigma factor [Planctomycetota bacterium]
MFTTKNSLIFRIRDSSDRDAWSHFVDIYGPLVYRYGRRRGLQDADAADLSQTVLTEVSHCIDRFDYDPALGRFRNWLMVIARYKLSALTRDRSKQIGTSAALTHDRLDQQPAADEFSTLWEAEYQNYLFRWAANLVRDEIEERTWQAFWRTAVENKTSSDVATELGMRVGTVYAAKCRVILRIRQKIAEVDDTVEAIA